MLGAHFGPLHECRQLCRSCAPVIVSITYAQALSALPTSHPAATCHVVHTDRLPFFYINRTTNYTCNTPKSSVAPDAAYHRHDTDGGRWSYLVNQKRYGKTCSFIGRYHLEEPPVQVSRKSIMVWWRNEQISAKNAKSMNSCMNTCMQRKNQERYEEVGLGA